MERKLQIRQYGVGEWSRGGIDTIESLGRMKCKGGDGREFIPQILVGPLLWVGLQQG